MSKIVRVTGDTLPCRQNLKAVGFSWNAEKQRWYQSVSDTHAEWLVADPVATLARFHWSFPGCLISIGEIVLSDSRRPAQAAKSTRRGDEYSLDAHGNYCPGRAIPGSDPCDHE